MNVQFASRAWEDCLHWQQFDRKKLKKGNELLKDITRNPCTKIGESEPLKPALNGFWSRRITDVHRLVYRAEGKVIHVAQARYNYE